jgi:ubiquinone/menaquinone biosynthesis C-methylase UbiE
MKYDPSLFAGAEDYYEKYRPKYPLELFDEIVKTFKPGRNEDILLDLGCGTGEIALPLAEYFKKVLAYDPDAEMLKLAQRKASQQNAKNIEFAQKSSDNLLEITSSVKLVAMGMSFHWMDGVKTLVDIKKILTDDGGVAILNQRHNLNVYSKLINEPNGITDQRNGVVEECVKKFFGETRRAGKQSYITGTQSFGEMLNQAGFRDIDEQTFDTTNQRTIGQIIGYIYSASWGRKSLLGDKADEFEEELKQKLLKLKSDGIFQERVIFSLLTAKKVC